MFWRQHSLVFLNGSVVGITDDIQHILQTVRTMRRKGYLDPFVSVSINNSTNSIFIASDAGRLCRPYIIVENGIPCLTQNEIDVNDIDLVKIKSKFRMSRPALKHLMI